MVHEMLQTSVEKRADNNLKNTHAFTLQILCIPFLKIKVYKNTSCKNDMPVSFILSSCTVPFTCKLNVSQMSNNNNKKKIHCNQ